MSSKVEAGVGRTLLSAAFDFDLAFDLSLKYSRSLPLPHKRDARAYIHAEVD
jgi:hypothetical protein